MLARLRALASDLMLLPHMWRFLVRQARNDIERPERHKREMARIAFLKEEAAKRGLTYQQLKTGCFRTSGM